jgi:hypothetical protein
LKHDFSRPSLVRAATFQIQDFQMFTRFFPRAVACASGLVLASPAFACSAHVCQLPSDWLSQGLAAHPDSTSISLRYDNVPQTQLRLDSKAVDRAAVPIPNVDEIEQTTYNHSLNLTINHSFGNDWVAEVQVPFVSRPHKTIAEGDNEISGSRTNGIGDARATVRYQGLGGKGVTGVEFGLKLPTGAFRQQFRSGPAAGTPVDRGLQPGSGTIDVILGIYHFAKLSGAFDYLIQVQGEIPFANREGFRPGMSGSATVGVTYQGWATAKPQLQLNFRAAKRDRGINADVAKSGGEQLFLAPGLSIRLSGSTVAFGIVQLPLYERVNGYQITPKLMGSLGVQHKF